MKNSLFVLGLVFSLSAVGCAHGGRHCGGHEKHHAGGCCQKESCKHDGCKHEAHDCGKGASEGCKMKNADQAPAPAETAQPQKK